MDEDTVIYLILIGVKLLIVSTKSVAICKAVPSMMDTPTIGTPPRLFLNVVFCTQLPTQCLHLDMFLRLDKVD